MKTYRILVSAFRKQIQMKLIFYVNGHNIASAYSKARNYISEEIKHKMEIIRIEKVI